MGRIINVGNFSIDFERLRAIKHNIYHDIGETNVVVIEYNARIEYLKNPFNDKIEKLEIVDRIDLEFSDLETAKKNHVSIQKDWNNYLESKIK